ncbi:50S ribosomal protein L6 [Candidatus Roizmanbacteria bacterium CG22_combo_CG10-13_8_21_14_all_34_12]|uniref:50S ribosomal protein L6 n=3 Tax=Candidatus Roizmaniibacteriota TaxID=1752723 RepID=A0A2H0C1T7_9BACT|nr:MAG: 50S ribosomal protein L6 [Candidatus Roizmanbacteria bacterium CG22_combo_CG10-13_8_21_14_all_34_12]
MENYYLVFGNPLGGINFMSKIGEKPVVLSSTVNLTIDNNKVNIKGPQGEMFFDVPKKLTLIKEGNNLIIKRNNNDKKVKSLHGLYRQLLGNAISGVEKPWEKKLEVVGTGYTVKLQGENLVFKIGYSHLVTFKKQPGIKYKVEGNNKVTVEGYDKQMVGQVAYQIKMIRKPDVYKGKGIRYLGEKLRIKPGKKAKAAGTAA